MSAVDAHSTDAIQEEKGGYEHQVDRIVLASLVASHLALGVVIVGWIGRVGHPFLLLAVASIPWTQASLLALWAATSRARSYTRCLLLILGLFWVAYVEARSLGLSVEGDVTAAHAMMLTTQTAMVFALAWMARFVISMRHAADRSDPPRQVGLAWLMAWVGAIAIVLAVVRLIWLRSGWTAQAAEGRYFVFAVMVGLFNACYALLTAWAVLLGSKRLVLRLVFALVLAGAIASLSRPLVMALLDEDGDLNVAQWVAQAGLQVGLTLVTLLPLRVVRRRRAASNAASGLAAGNSPG